MAFLNYNGLKRYDKKTKEYIEDKIKKINNIDVDELATKAELDTKANKSDIFSGDYNDLTNKPNIPDTTNLAAKTDLATHTNNDNIHVTSSEKSKWNAKLDNTSLKDYATKVYVTDEIAKAATSGTVDLTGYAKTADVNSALNTKVDKVTGKSLVSDAEINRLSKVSNYDDTSIKNSITNINSQLNTKANKSDLFSKSYNDLTDKPTIPSLDGYATKTYVTDEINKASLSGGTVDLSGYAKKTDLNAHTSNTNIHMTSAERTKLNEINDKIESLKPTKYLKYEGEDITCENTATGTTSDMLIKGKTYQNLITGKKSSLNINYENGVITSQITPSTDVSPVIQLNVPNAKVNQKYTFLCNVIENKPNTSIFAGGSNDQHEIMNKNELKMGINKIVFTSKSTLTDNITLPIWFRVSPNIQQSVKIKDVILLEGDWTNKKVPASITGIESAGEKENKISILSKNNLSADGVNYKEYKKEILLPIDDGLKSMPNGVADTIEQRSDGVYLVQRVKKMPLYGSVSFNYPQEQNSTNTVLIYFTNTHDGILYSNNIICNAIKKYSGGGDIWSSSFDEEDMKLNQKADLLIRINKSKLDTVDYNGIKKFIDDNQLTVCYEFNTPIETKLDIQNLDLEVHEGTTYITTDNAIQPTLKFKAQSYIGDLINDANVSNKTTYSSEKIEEKINNQYCYTHGCKFEVEKHFNIFNLSSLKQGSSFNSI